MRRLSAYGIANSALCIYTFITVLPGESSGRVG